MINPTPPQRVLVLLSGLLFAAGEPTGHARTSVASRLTPRVRAVKGDLTNRPARFPRPADSFNCGFRNQDCGLMKSTLLQIRIPQSEIKNPKPRPSSRPPVV